MIRLLRRFSYELLLVGLVALIVLAGLFVLTVALPGLQGAASAPSPSPTPQATSRSLVMSWLNLPPDADCAACHLTSQGGVGVRPVPKVAHPLRGWTDCTACHANERLVATAPGHGGLHATDCLICHEPAELPAPLSRPHRELQNQDCLECHGDTAPLPDDMAHRTESVCWLCHRLPQEEPPLPAHPITAGQTDCLSCHGAGPQGPMPPDHATRSASECLLCHAPQPGASLSPAPTQPAGQQGLGRPVLSRAQFRDAEDS
jgi:hypothetical protein